MVLCNVNYMLPYEHRCKDRRPLEKTVLILRTIFIPVHFIENNTLQCMQTLENVCISASAHLKVPYLHISSNSSRSVLTMGIEHFPSSFST